MYKIFLLLLVAALLLSCRQVGRDKWDFNPVSMALYEDIAPLSSMDKNVYLRRTRATGMLTVSGPGIKLDLVKFAKVRVTQAFQEKIRIMPCCRARIRMVPLFACWWLCHTVT